MLSCPGRGREPDETPRPLPLAGPEGCSGGGRAGSPRGWLACPEGFALLFLWHRVENQEQDLASGAAGRAGCRRLLSAGPCPLPPGGVPVPRRGALPDSRPCACLRGSFPPALPGSVSPSRLQEAPVRVSDPRRARSGAAGSRCPGTSDFTVPLKNTVFLVRRRIPRRRQHRAAPLSAARGAAAARPSPRPGPDPSPGAWPPPPPEAPPPGCATTARGAPPLSDSATRPMTGGRSRLRIVSANRDGAGRALRPQPSPFPFRR